MDWIDAVADRRIRAAQERGEFDNLPHAGRPLDLSDADDPDWWIKSYLRREGVSGQDVVPSPVALRRERAGFPRSLLAFCDELAVREYLEDFNRRVRRDILTPQPIPVPHARTVDVDELVAVWRDLSGRRDEPDR